MIDINLSSLNYLYKNAEPLLDRGLSAVPKGLVILGLTKC